MLADEDFWDDILGHLKQRVLIPVVGPELLRAAKDGAPPKTLSRFLGERLAERYNLAVDWNERAGLDDAVRAYVTANGRDKSERLYRVVNDILAAANWPITEPLKHLAAIRDFDLFISTTFDSLLANAIDEVRFNGQRLTRSLWFAANQSTAVRERTMQAPPSRDEAVVFKVFGEVASTQQYALNDEDLLEWLHALLTEATSMPEWLGPQLKQQPLLFVGCQFSEWIGRFLMRLVSERRLSSASKQYFLVGTDIGRHEALADFLRTYCGSTRVQIFNTDAGEFTAELLRRWTARNPSQPARAEPSSEAAPRGTIFISYVREDATAARRLAAAIAALGGDVWLDERRLQPGDRWEDEILTSIRRHVCLFVPLISKHTEEREEGYVFKEWREAVERAKGIPKRRFIVPIVLDEDFSGNPAVYRQVPNEFLTFHFGRAPAGLPDSDLLASLTDQIRAMRRKDAA